MPALGADAAATLREILLDPAIPVSTLAGLPGGQRISALREALDHLNTLRVGALAASADSGAGFLDALAQIDPGLSDALRWHATLAGLLAALPPGPARNAVLGDVHRGELLTWGTAAGEWRWEDAVPGSAEPVGHATGTVHVDHYPGLYDSLVAWDPGAGALVVVPTHRSRITWEPALGGAGTWTVHLAGVTVHAHELVPVAGNPTGLRAWREYEGAGVTVAEPRVGDVVITAGQLRALRESGARVVILEIQRATASADPATVERIPGAHLVNIQTQLIGERYEGSGMNPLPTREQIQAEIERWGIDADSEVVVYSRENASLSARGWWTLTWAGLPHVRYLDGGLSAWTAAGGGLSTQPAPEGGGTFTAATGTLPSVGSAGAAEIARSGHLIDVRGPDAYTGASGGGHVPGAVNRPSADVLTDDGFLQDDAVLRERYKDLGVGEDTEVGVYCGGGTSASLSALALARIGITATLYPGSFSAWESDPQRPVATGEAP